MVLGQAHDNIPPVVFPPRERRMTDKLPVAADRADAVFAGQGHAAFALGAAVGGVGVGVAAAVVGYLSVQGHVDLARADGDGQDVHRALAEILFRAFQARARLALGRQQMQQQLGHRHVIEARFAERILVRVSFEAGSATPLRCWATSPNGTSRLFSRLRMNGLTNFWWDEWRTNVAGCKSAVNFGGEVMLHGAGQVFWWCCNPKGRAAPFLCPKFSRIK